MKLDIQFFAGSTIYLGKVSNGSNAYMEGRLVWTATAGSPIENYSICTFKLQARRNDSISDPTSGKQWKGSVIVKTDLEELKPINFTSLDSQKSVGQSWVTLKEVSGIKVNHNTDGTCTPEITGSITGCTNTSFEGKVMSASESVTFDRILRQCELSTISRFNIDMGFVFNSTKESDTFYRKLLVKNGAIVLNTIYEESLINGYEYLLSDDINTIYTIMSNEFEHTFTFELYTYSDSTMSTQIGDASVQTAVGYVSDCTPTFSGFDCVNSRSSAVSVTGSNQIYIPNYSDATITINTPAEAYKGATIVGYNINGYGYIPIGTYPLTYTIYNVNSSFSIQAVDSRGAVSNTIQKNLNLLVGYKAPELRNFISARSGGIGTEVKLIVSGAIWEGNFGNGENKITRVAYRVQPKGGSYSEWYDITSYLSLGDETAFIIDEDSGFYLHANGSSDGFPEGLSYTVQLALYDGTNGVTFNSAIAEVVIEDGYVLDSYYKATNGYKYAINKIVDPDGAELQLEGNADINGALKVIDNGKTTNITNDSNGNSSFTTDANKFNFNKRINCESIINQKYKKLFVRSAGYVSTATYYLLAKLPASSSATGDVLNIKGYLGGYGSNEQAVIDVLIGNRGGITCNGTYIGSNTIAFSYSSIRLYTDNGETYVYLMVYSWCGNIRLEVSGMWNEIYDTFTATTTPVGTLALVVNHNVLHKISDLFYRAGNTYEVTNIIMPGHLTASSTTLQVIVNVPKRLDNITSITCTSLSVESRGISGYLNSESGFIEYVGTSGYTVSCTKLSENTVGITITKSSAYTNCTNNTPIVLWGKVSLTFN